MIKQLLSIRLRKLFVGPIFMADKKKSASVGKIILGIVLYLFIVASLLVFSISFAASLASVLVPLGLDWLYFLLYFLAVLLLLFVLGIFESKAELYECKDNAILIPLPISARDIVCSRMLVLLLYHYLECAFIFLPAIIFYLVFGGSPWALLGGAFFFLLMPLVTASLSAICGFFLSKLTSRIKNKTAFTLIVSLAFLGAYFFGYSALINGLDAVFENFEGIAADLGLKLSALRFFGDIVLAKPIPLLVFILSSLAVAYLCLRVVIRFYFRTAPEQNTGATVLRYESTARSRSPMLALVQKELRRFFASANYMLNCGLGVLMAPIAAILALVKREELVQLCSEFGIELAAAAPIAIGVISLCLMMNYMSGVALSLEGDSFWVVRSLPVKTTDIIFSKVIASAVVNTPSLLISSTLFCILFSPSFLEGVAIFLLPFVLSVATSLLYAVINILFPKMKFDNEVAVIKQSAASFFGAIGSMLIGAGLVYLALLAILCSASWIFYVSSIALALIIGVPSFVLLVTVMPQKVENL